jgi:hypothetical protein
MSWKRMLWMIGSTAAVITTLAVPAGAGANTESSPVVAATPAAAADASGTDASVLAWYPKHVKSTVSEIRVFTSPYGNDIYGYYGPCTNFWTDRTDGSRYHIVLPGGVDAWVTSDSAYVAPGHC